MEILKFETNKKRNLFFSKSNISPNKKDKNIEYKVINVYPEIKYQTILGFGGAFTEASNLNYLNLSTDTKQSFIKDYFTEDGISYSICRVPIGSTDFSEKSYSYAKKKDLSDFSIDEDKRTLLPLIKDALLKNPNIALLASPWSPPKFMKTNKMLSLGGRLLPKYYDLYAEYLLKYILAYKQEGINIDYITVQNEPNATQIWESCLFTEKEESLFIKEHLFPIFKKNDIKTKILFYDHNKDYLYNRAKKELIEENLSGYVDGIAYHYYTGDHFENLELFNKAFSDKLLIHTEGCTGYSSFKEQDDLNNAEIYAHDIMGDLNHFSNGYIDWNLMLDKKGGPNHVKNYCDSPIMRKDDDKSYVKKLAYYYIGHFSKFIKPNAKRIANSRYNANIEVGSFENPDGSIIIVLFNRSGNQYQYNILMDDMYIHDNLDSHAIITYIIRK